VKCGRKWNSFEQGTDKTDSAVGFIFKKSNIKEAMKDSVKTFYTNDCVRYEERSSRLIFQKLGDVGV
jgi:hypothetical protein